MPYDKSSTEVTAWYSKVENLDSLPIGNPAIYTDVYPAAPTSGKNPLVSTSSAHGDFCPEWRSKIAAGENATTNFVAVTNQYHCEPWVNHLRGSTLKNNNGWEYQRKQACWWSGDLAVASNPSAACVNRAVNLASTRFYKKLNEQRVLIEGGTVLGELMETVRMIASPAKALRQGLDDYLSVVKKQRQGRPALAAKRVADTWLEASFGWLPLLHDLDDAFAYLSKRESQLQKKYFRVVGSAEASESADTYFVKAFNFATGRSRVLTTKKARKRYIGVVAATSGNGQPVSWQSAMGLAPSNFVPTLWELLPWSFAVDYFTNVGDILSIYSMGKVKLAWGCETLVTESRNHLTGVTTMPVAASLPTVRYNASSGGTGYSYRKTVTRAPLTYVPLPEFSFELPGASTKWLNLAALRAKRL